MITKSTIIFIGLFSAGIYYFVNYYLIYIPGILYQIRNPLLPIFENQINETLT